MAPALRLDHADRRVSPWPATAYRPVLGETSFREVSADVAVLGGGIVGVTAALLAARDGARVVLVEAGRIGQGVTAQSTVKATLGHGMMLGQIAPKNLFDVRPDLRAMAVLFKLKERNAHTIFGAIANSIFGPGDIRSIGPAAIQSGSAAVFVA